MVCCACSALGVAMTTPSRSSSRSDSKRSCSITPGSSLDTPASASEWGSATAASSMISALRIALSLFLPIQPMPANPTRGRRLRRVVVELPDVNDGFVFAEADFVVISEQDERLCKSFRLLLKCPECALDILFGERVGVERIGVQTTLNQCVYCFPDPLHVDRGIPLMRIDHIQPSPVPRSEEHTSELQSRGHLVCRLLLEKTNQ